MIKLREKLILRMMFVIMLVFSLSLFTNNYLLSKFYFYETNNNIKKLIHQFDNKSIEDTINMIEKIEKDSQISIVYDVINKDNDYLNNSLRIALSNKNIKLNKFWISEDTITKVKNGETVRKIFNQGKIKSSFLVNVFKKEHYVFIVGMSVVHSREIINITNLFNIYIMIMSIVFSVVLMIFFSKNVTKPLKELSDASMAISMLDYKKVDIYTGDEIEELARHINSMSEKLELTHNQLNAKNDGLKTFISQVSHEFKTPLTLIKAYTIGIQDGLDDGTYTNVILNRADDLSELIDELLLYSRVEREMICREWTELDTIIKESLSKYRLMFEKSEIGVNYKNTLEYKSLIWVDRYKILMVINNLVENGLKYSADKNVVIQLEDYNEKIKFTIYNSVSNFSEDVIDNIWNPFYIGNEGTSGSGLGLSIVKSILDMHELEYNYRLEENRFEIEIMFERSEI